MHASLLPRRLTNAIGPLIVVFTLAAAGLIGCGDEDLGTPTLGFLVPQPNDVISIDEDVTTDGLQIRVQVSIDTFEDRVGLLTLVLEGQDDLPNAVSVDGEGTYIIDGFTLLEGPNRLFAELLVDGEVAATARLTVMVEPAAE